MGWGGKRIGSGRKSKSDEVRLLEQLVPYDSLAVQKLVECMEQGNPKCIQMFLDRRWGKPIETQNISLVEELPTYEVIVLDDDSESKD